MRYAPYTIMQRRYYYAGTLGVNRGWQPVQEIYDQDADDCPTANDASDARRLIGILESSLYYLSHGEYSPPDYGYVQPSGRIRKIV